MRLTLNTSFLSLNLALFETSSDDGETLLSNIGGTYDIAPAEEAEYEYEEDNAFGLRPQP